MIILFQESHQEISRTNMEYETRNYSNIEFLSSIVERTVDKNIHADGSIQQISLGKQKLPSLQYTTVHINLPLTFQTPYIFFVGYSNTIFMINTKQNY